MDVRPDAPDAMGPRPGRLVVTSGGRTFEVDCAAVDPGWKYSVLVDGRSFDVIVDQGDGASEGIARELALIVDGHAWHAAVEDERERAMSRIAGHPIVASGVVESAMPGIVRKVEVRPGDAVVAGTRLLVLEAMKMENEIRAPHGGTVASLKVEPGMLVERNDALITLS
jgi:biotin carboxyl carrier protein